MIDSDKAALNTLAEKACQSYHLGAQPAEKLLLNPGEWERLVPPGVQPELRRAGCGAIRMLGRLAYLTHYRSLREWLGPMLLELGQTGSIRVTLVGSLAGGTASVLLCELPFLFRHLSQELTATIPLTIEAVVLGSARPARHERGASNPYATLIELNHWQASDTVYRLQVPGETEWEWPTPPFEQILLFSCRDLEDPREHEALSLQVSAYLGLPLWPAYTALAEEVGRRQAAFWGQADERGNPVAFFSLGSSSLSLPFDEIRTALASRILARLVERWQQQIARQSEGPETPRAALDFLHREALARHVFVEELGRAAGGPGAFRQNRELAALREELERKPSQGPALVARLRTLESLFLATLGESRPDGLFGRVSERGSELVARGTKALSEEVNGFFRSDRPLGYATYLEQLSDALGDRLRSLYEEMSQLELDELRLSQEKEQGLRQAEAEDVGVLDRVFRRKRTSSPAAPLAELIERYYQCRLGLHIHREAWNAFQELLLLVERLRSEVRTVYDYLEQMATLLKDRHTQALGQIFSMPGEVLISRPEVDEYLVDRAAGDQVDTAAGWVREALQLELPELPHHFKPSEAAHAMIMAVGQRLAGLEGIDAVDKFFQRYQGPAAEVQLEQLLARARPTLQPRQQLEDWTPQEAVLVALHSGTGEESPAHQKLTAFLLGQGLNLSIVPFLSRDRLVFLRMAGGVPLRALELAPLHQAYLSELQGSRIAPHCRTDVRWRALSRPSNSEVERLWENLAVAVRLGHLETGDFFSSPRCPDLTSVLACQALYAEVEEGLLTEVNLLKGLERWQQEWIEEQGVEAFLRRLDQPDDQTLLGRELHEPLRRAAARLRQQMEGSWAEWEAVIAGYLSHSPTLTEIDLVEIPAGFRAWAMSQFQQVHPADRVTFQAATGTLEVRRAGDRAHLEAACRRLVESQTGDQEGFARAVGDLADTFCQALGWHSDRALGLGTVWGKLVKTHGLRVKIPSPLPFLACQRAILSHQDAANLRLLLEQLGQVNRFGILIVTGERESNHAILAEGLAGLLPPTLILLTPDDLVRMMGSENPLASLLEQVDLAAISPFVTEGPVPPSMFFGRESELREVLYRLEHSNLALVGPHRIGKTSLLQRSLEALRRSELAVFYLDCHSLARGSDFLLHLASEHLSDWEPRMSFPAILMELQHRHDGRQALLILDEIDPLLTNDQANSEFLARAFRQAASEGKARFLLAGDSSLHQRLHQAESAFCNLAYPVKLGFLPPSEASALILEPLEQLQVRFENSQEALDLLLYVTAGHPNLIQRACSALVSRLSPSKTRQVDRDLLEEVLGEKSFGEEYLATLWGSSGTKERLVSLAIEPDEELTVQELHGRLESDFKVKLAMPELLDSLENLCFCGILERQGSRFGFATRSFPEVVRHLMDVHEGVERYREELLKGV
ncbi:MAG: hypothetical protein AMXMBFR33_52610 [Candidatus Xenobia bacterium]